MFVSRSLQGGAAHQAAKRRRENVEEAEIETTTQALVTTQETETSVTVRDIIDLEAVTFVTQGEFSAMEKYFRTNPDPSMEMIFKAIKDRLNQPGR